MPHRNGNKGHQQQGRGSEERGARAEERYVEERDSGFGGRGEYEPRFAGGRERWQSGARWGEDEERGGYREGRPMYGPEDRGPTYQGELAGAPRFQGGGRSRGEQGFGRFRDEGSYRDEGSHGFRDYGDEDARGQGFYGQAQGGFGQREPRGYGQGSYGQGDSGYGQGSYGSRGSRGAEGGHYAGHGSFGGDRGSFGGGQRGGYDLGSRTGQGEGSFGGRSNASQSTRGQHYGKSPQGYTRSDDRIREEVCDLLMQGHVDPSQITVRVQNGEVTLEGRVDARDEKYHVEELAEGVLGVKEVDNRLRVGSRSQREEGTSNEERERGRASEKSGTSRGTTA